METNRFLITSMLFGFQNSLMKLVHVQVQINMITMYKLNERKVILCTYIVLKILNRM